MFQNRISLIGFTGTDVQVRTTKNNRNFAVLSVTTKRSWLDKQSGERVSRTEWHRVVAWGKLSDFAKTLAKGSHVQIAGELRSRTYTTKEGLQRRVSEVHLGSIRRLDRAERKAEAAAPAEQLAASTGVSFSRMPGQFQIKIEHRTMQTYDSWLNDVRSALASINMPLDEWQRAWPYDFAAEYEAGTEPAKTADRANRFWWHQQNKSIGQDCRRAPNCWLPQGHQGKCQPVQEAHS